MKSFVLVGLFGALVGGMAGSAATLALGGSFLVAPEKGAKPKRAAPESEGQEMSQVADLPLEQDSLARLRKLERRLSLMTRALAERGMQQSSEDDAEEDILPDGASDVADPVFEAAVLDIIDRKEERKTEERDAYRQALRAERGRRFASSLAENLELSVEEQEKVSQVITDYFDSLREIRNSPERPVTRREWQEKREEMRVSLETSLEESMSPAQYEQYQELPEDDKIGLGRPRGGRGQGRQRQGGE